MANIKFGAVITDSRGSIGGMTFKASRYGMVMTNKSQPPRRDSHRRSKINANFSTLTKKWWTVLDSTQRTAWRDLAAANPITNRWGDEYPLTGLAYFVRLNQRLFTANLTQIDDAPSDQAVTSPLSAALSASAPSTASLTFSATPVPTDHIAYVFGTPPLSPGAANFDHRFYFLTASSSGATSPLNLSSAWTSLTGAILAGRQYAARLHFLNTSNAALSPAIEAVTIAT